MSAGRNLKFVWLDEFTRRGPKAASVFRVGVALANRENNDGSAVFLSAKRAAELTPYSERSCERAFAALMESGWIERTRKGGRRGEKSVASTYRLAIPNPTDQVPNPTKSDSQPDKTSSQPDSGDGLVDPLSVDPSLVDPFSVDPLSGDEDRAWRPLVESFNCTNVDDFSGDLIGELIADDDHIVRIEPDEYTGRIDDRRCGCIDGMSCPDCRGDASSTSSPRQGDELAPATRAPVDSKPAISRWSSPSGQTGW